jgi:hypothetical protein
MKIHHPVPSMDMSIKVIRQPEQPYCMMFKAFKGQEGRGRRSNCHHSVSTKERKTLKE